LWGGWLGVDCVEGEDVEAMVERYKKGGVA